jgi:uncharacterized protein (DUF1015 family)
MVLSPFLAIRDLRDDERIEYVSGKHSILELKKIIDVSLPLDSFFSLLSMKLKLWRMLI